MKTHENIVVFATVDTIYNPQKFKGKPYTAKGNPKVVPGKTSGTPPISKTTINEGDRFPISIINFMLDRPKIHPTQKPVELCSYLIKTYTNENEIVLDNCMGSGTTAVAATLNNRKWLGFETESTYIEVANKRLEQIQLEDDLNNYAIQN
jgi:site-specific DNA-methyltransferase (adenine-specific)